MKIQYGKSGNMNFFEQYKERKILITGHTGFKGGWLSIWLEMLGAEIVGYSLDPIHEDGIFNKSEIGNKIKDYRGDIRDLKKLIEVFNAEKPEIVFHLAAQPLVLESYKNPVETFEVNTMGTVNVLEAIRLTPSVKAAVMITTDKCYENKEWIWGYRENDQMGGHDPYSASKGAAELVIAGYRKSFFHDENKPAIASVRAGNVMGGGDWSDNRLVPDIIRAIQNNQTIEIRNPYSTRPWQHVLEPLSGYLKLGIALLENTHEYAEGWNFGPYSHDAHSVKQVVENIIDFAKKGHWKYLSSIEKKHEANLLMLDISKALQKLNWKPTLSFKERIHFTVDWYFNAIKNSALEFTQQQIFNFQELWKLRNEN